MSPRAASRLASIGFEPVYDYVAGKADWGSAGLPLEGEHGSETRAGAHLRTDVPTCRPDDRLHHVRTQLDESGWATCFVVDDRRVLLGRIERRAISGRADVSAAEAMALGPSTVRPSGRLEEMVGRMRRQSLTALPVTRSDGTLLGLLALDDAEAAVQRQRG